MKTSEKGKKLLAQWEGVVLHKYKDDAGLPTIGVGHLLTPKELSTGKLLINGVEVPYANGISLQQALDLLAQDLIPAETAVNGQVKAVLNQNQFDALVIFTFNIGCGGFKSSSALKAVNAEDFASVPADMMKWNKITKDGEKVVCDGLVKRRNNEIRLWKGEI